MKKNKNIDELFRDKLENFAPEPPAYLLENILAGAAAARRRKKIVFWRIAGVAAALLLAFIAGWQLNYLNSEKPGQNIEMAQSEIQKPEQEAATQSEEIITENNGKAETLVAQISTEPKTARNNLLASSTKNQRSGAQAEVEVTVQIKESVDLNVIQGHDAEAISTPEIELALEEMSIPETSADSEELTFDQQIMKQNHEMLMAEKSAKEKTRWIVGAQVSPVYSNSRNSQTAGYASNMLNSSNSNPVDLGGGISVEIKTGKRWSVQSGVYYSALGQSSGNSTFSAQKDNVFADAGHGSDYFNTNVSIEPGSNKMLMNSAAGVIEFSGIPSGIEIAGSPEENNLAAAAVVSDARFVQNFEYIEIPLYLRYALIDSRFDVEMLGGFSSNILVGNQTFMESAGENNLIGKTQDMQTVNYSGTVGVGFKYGLSKRLFLNVEPRIKYYLNSLNSSSAVTYKPYTIGVYSGLSYEF